MQDARDPAVSLVCSLFLTGVSLLWCKRDKHSSWIIPCLSCSVITIIKQALAQQSSPDLRHWLCCYTCTSHQVLASQLWPPAHSHSPPASTHFLLTVALPYMIFTSERCWGARQWGSIGAQLWHTQQLSQNSRVKVWTKSNHHHWLT